MNRNAYPKNHRRHERGITLIEAVTASVIVGILAVVGSNFVSDSLLLSKRATAQSYNASSARYAMDRMAREIREVGIAGGRQISVMTAQRMVFVSASSQAVGNKETEFIFDTQAKTISMRQGLAETAKPLATNVNSFSLAYYDRLGFVTTSAAAVRTVGISLETKDDDSPAIALKTRIALRN